MSNLIINGDFATGNLNGWTQIQTQNVFVGTPGFNSTYCYFIGNYNTFSPLISQSINTTVGHVYTLTYYLKNETTNGYLCQFSSLINGVTVPGSYINTSAVFDWSLYTFNFTATASVTTLSFNSLINFFDPTYMLLDDIMIVDITPKPIVSKPIMVFGRGSNSNGQFWYGSQTNFPGFLYKKNVGVGARRSTKMGPGGNITCNSATDLYNKYKPGQGGVGASSISNRRAKNRLATVCNGNNKCFPCYSTLGQYSNYTHNPNGFIPCPGTVTVNSVTTLR